MPTDAHLVVAARAVTRQSRPASACNDRRLGSRRFPSACSRQGESTFLAQSSPHEPAGSTNSSLGDEITSDVDRALPNSAEDGVIDNLSLQGMSEEKQYPHFFAWLNMQKQKRPQSANKQQQQQQQWQNNNSRPASTYGNQRPSSAAKAPTGGQFSPSRTNSRPQSPCSTVGQQSNSRPSSPKFGQGSRPRSPMDARPASASPGQRQQQLYTQQPSCSRPHSAVVRSNVSAQSTQQPSHNSVTTAVPAWFQQRAETASNGRPALAPAGALSSPSAYAIQQQQQPGSPAFRASGLAATGWDAVAQNSSGANATPTHQMFSTPGLSTQHHQQQQLDPSEQAAIQLFQQLPMAEGVTVDRHALQLLLLGLQCELARLGPPVTLHVPAFTTDGSLDIEGWSAHDQVAPELQVWDKLTTELCRQTRVECSQRGVLLLTAVIRQRQLLHMALSACNDMFSRMQEVSKGAQQLHQTVGDLQIELGHKQQQHENLQADLQAEQQKCVSVARELQQQQDRMRKGRYHLIAEEVQQAKADIDKRWMNHLTEQVQLTKVQCAADEDVKRQQWQEQVLQTIADTAGDGVADSIRVRLQAEAAAEEDDSS